jgi:hypothetical protein
MKTKKKSAAPINLPPAGTVRLGTPTDKHFLAAAGQLACAAGTHELVLQYLYKTILEIDLKTALWATEQGYIEDIRRSCRKCFIKKVKDESEIAKLDSLLNRSRNLMKKRNSILHRGWAINDKGILVSKDEDQNFSKPPKILELDEVSKKLIELNDEINSARLGGYLSQAIVAARSSAE